MPIKRLLKSSYHKIRKLFNSPDDSMECMTEDKVINPAAEALKKKNPFTDGSFDGTTKIKEGAGYNPNEFHKKGEINIIDGEEFEVPANQKIIVPDPENPKQAIEVDNISRGKVGYVSNPEEIAKLKAQGIPVNDNAPLTPTVADMQKKFDESKLDKAKQIRIRNEKAVKMRCKMQNAPYKPPADLADVPSLAPYDPSKDNVQAVEPKADTSLGEVMLSEDGSENNVNKSQDQSVVNNQQQGKPAMKIEDVDTSASATDGTENMTTNTDAIGTDSNPNSNSNQ